MLYFLMRDYGAKRAIKIKEETKIGKLFLVEF